MSFFHPQSFESRNHMTIFVNLITIKLLLVPNQLEIYLLSKRPCSAVGSESDCRSRDCEFDPSQVPYFRWDWLSNNFSDHSPPSTDSRKIVVSYKGKYARLAKCRQISIFAMPVAFTGKYREIMANIGKYWQIWYTTFHIKIGNFNNRGYLS